MTKNYLPITEPGTVRQRVMRVEMNNKFDSVPYIVWLEEEQILLADGSYKYAPAGFMSTQANAESLAESFPIINPDTGQALGQMTGQELLVAIQSYYIFKATQRDAEAATGAPTP